jgi:hypothetical protein
MNEYARATGRESRIKNPPVKNIAPAPRVLQPLSDIDQARVAEKRQLVMTHMPELVPEIKELVALGLIDGWRNVRSVKILKKDLP